MIVQLLVYLRLQVEQCHRDWLLGSAASNRGLGGTKSREVLTHGYHYCDWSQVMERHKVTAQKTR